MSIDYDLLVAMYNDKAENILVVDDPAGSNNDKAIAAIYFSSLAIVPAPRDVDNFVRRIIKKDRYEWFSTRVEKASRHIFVRDLNLIWYQGGVSSRNDTIDKVADELRMLIEGYDAICIGSSAGGYAAMLFSKLIGAKICFAFSPCIDVNRFIRGHRKNIKGSECLDKKYNRLLEAPGKYNNLMELYRGNKMPVYAYFPVLSQLDKIELEDACKIPSIRMFLHNSELHAFPFSGQVVQKIINETLKGASSNLYNGNTLNDIEIASMMSVPVEEVAARRKGLRFKLRKYKCKNIVEYAFVSSAYKLCKTLLKFLGDRGLFVE